MLFLGYFLTSVSLFFFYGTSVHWMCDLLHWPSRYLNFSLLFYMPLPFFLSPERFLHLHLLDYLLKFLKIIAAMTQGWTIERTHETLQGVLEQGFREGRGYGAAAEGSTGKYGRGAGHPGAVPRLLSLSHRMRFDFTLWTVRVFESSSLIWEGVFSTLLVT